MTARTGILILLVALSLTASWLHGYREGQQTGAFHLLRDMNETNERDAMDRDRDQVCSEIRAYNFSIAKDLDEHTQICGWPDLDGQENSN